MNKPLIVIALIAVFTVIGCSDSTGSDDGGDTADSEDGSTDTSDDTTTGDSGSVDYSDCSSCHETPPETFPHVDPQHDALACNNPYCHGDMINQAGTALVDGTLHDNGSLDTTCGSSSCHGNTESCESCHGTPPAASPHNETGHADLSCDNPNCHGAMVNADGSQLLDESIHNDGTVDATCGSEAAACHGTAQVCGSCHGIPPAGQPHGGSHKSIGCNDPNCHGNMVNGDGSAILEPASHNDGTVDATCDGCH